MTEQAAADLYIPNEVCQIGLQIKHYANKNSKMILHFCYNFTKVYEKLRKNTHIFSLKKKLKDETTNSYYVITEEKGVTY